MLRTGPPVMQIPGEGLWYLFLNASALASSSHELPISMFALETQLCDGVPKAVFVPHKLSIATFEMERLTLDHVSSVHSAADTESARTCWYTNVLSVCERASCRHYAGPKTFAAYFGGFVTGHMPP